MIVKELINHIQLLPGALVDSNFRQGQDVVLKQLTKRTGEDETENVATFIKNSQNAIPQLIQKVNPYDVPLDYIFFLEYFGGLAIRNQEYYFSVYGIGPMVEDWYSAIDSDEVFPEPRDFGFLSLGSLNFRKGIYKSQYVDFFLDIAGRVQRHCVIGIGPWGGDDLDSFTIVKDISEYSTKWKKVADSFTEWLEQAAETAGLFNYT